VFEILGTGLKSFLIEAVGRTPSFRVDMRGQLFLPSYQTGSLKKSGTLLSEKSVSIMMMMNLKLLIPYFSHFVLDHIPDPSTGYRYFSLALSDGRIVISQHLTFGLAIM
jgi:hypothetical protein